jgi:TRAP-type C4-dicarboxylate transport system substrate-binding protein
MQSKSLLKTVMGISLFLVLVTATFAMASSQPATTPKSSPGLRVALANPNPIELKAVSFLPRMASKTKLFKLFSDKVGEVSKGELSIKILGGPEVIGVMEQGQGVSRGVVDMAMLPPGLIQGMVPESLFPLLTRITQEEEIKRGVIKKLQPFYNKVNLYCLGEIFGVNDPQFLTYTTSRKIEKPQQLAGLSIGGTGPMTNPIGRVLGIDIKVIPLSEVYTALERKVVDGWISPAGGIVGSGAYEQLKYAIDHPFFADYVVIIMNLNKWKSLSTNLQALLQDTLLTMAPELGAMNQNDEMKARQKFRDGGVQFIKFSQADSEWYLNSIYDAMWNDWIKRMPQTGPEFRKLLSP